MPKNEILIVGDSFTAGVNPRDKNGSSLWPKGGPMINPAFPLWPELFAKKLNMSYRNLACGGRGNQWIYNRVVDNYDGEKLIVVLWSDYDRLDFEKETITLRLDLKKDAFKVNKFYSSLNSARTIERRGKVFDVLHDAGLIDPKYNFEKSIRLVLSFQNFCEVNDVRYFHAQGFHPTSLPSTVFSQHDFLKYFINLKIAWGINDEHFLGWPMFNEIGGFTITDKLDELDPERKRLRVSDEDTHPNIEGNQVIANIFYHFYQGLYND